MRDALNELDLIEQMTIPSAVELVIGKLRIGRLYYHRTMTFFQAFDMKKFLAMRSGGNDPAKWLTGANALPVAGQAIGSL